jgi:hypothetical protein
MRSITSSKPSSRALAAFAALPAGGATMPFGPIMMRKFWGNSSKRKPN